MTACSTSSSVRIRPHECLRDPPAFWWFTGFHPDYHHITDTVEKIDFAKMKKILDLAYLSAWRFANNSAVPKFVANPKP